MSDVQVQVLAGAVMVGTNPLMPGELVDVTVDAGVVTGVHAHVPGRDWGPVSVLDAAGRVLMPGLIDAHTHLAFTEVTAGQALTCDPGYLHARAVTAAAGMLARGFTTVRDCGGPVFGLKQAIDEGHVPGPRIFPSGAMVSQTGGHGDFRHRSDVPSCGCTVSYPERLGAVRVADGADRVLTACREQLMLGASQVKVMAGGGVSSVYDPLDVTQYTPAELAAAVSAAENWGTYVTVHAYTPAAVRQAVIAGVRCVEHGQLLDDATAELMAERGVWWSVQPFCDDEDAIPMGSPVTRAKQLLVMEGTDRAFALAAKHGVRLAWGTDTLFDAGLAARQGAQLVKTARWMPAADVIRLATVGNGRLLAESGPRNPYPRPVGVVEPGAYADWLLVDGDPVTDLGLLADPDRFIVVKDGLVVPRH